jgi:hypothetical protein
VLLARTVTPEPMRPGWPQAMRMSESALPFRRMLSIDERLEQAAARPVIIPQSIVVDHGKPHIERMLGSVATMFAQYVSGYTGRSPEYRGRGTEETAVWSLPELQDLLDQWLVIWQARPHDGLRDPLHPGRAFSPNEKYAALTETAGYVPLALSPGDYIELLPAAWRAVNAYGIRISRRVYDGKELNPLRMQHWRRPWSPRSPLPRPCGRTAAFLELLPAAARARGVAPYFDRSRDVPGRRRQPGRRAERLVP